MKSTLKLVALTGAIAVFSACGQSNNEQGENAQVDHAQMDSHQPEQPSTKNGKAEHQNMDHNQMDHSKMDHSQMEHSQMEHAKMDGDFGHTTGKILDISTESREVTIDHQKIEGLAMGAMTMGFNILPGVNLGDYAPNDNVSFMVKKGSDGSFNIPAMCNSDKEGADCLDGHMKHDAHQ